MGRFYTTLLGSYRGQNYYLTVSGEPSINNVQDFAVTVHYDDPQTTETVEIARIDTSHDYVHFDRLYRADQGTDAVEIETPWEAEAYLRAPWRQYADSYAHNHT